MEQLASGLNRAAQTMMTDEQVNKEHAKPDLANLQVSLFSPCSFSSRPVLHTKGE